MRACLLLALVSATLVGCGKSEAPRAANDSSRAGDSFSDSADSDGETSIAAGESAATALTTDSFDRDGATDQPSALLSRVPGYQAGTLTAGSFDDHANFADYQTYLDSATSTTQHLLPQFKLGQRILINITDSQGRPLGDSRVVVKTANPQSPKTLLDTTTGADGQTLLLTGLDGAKQETEFSLHVYAPGESLPHVQKVTTKQSPWQVQLAKTQRQLPRKLDLSLVIDATGSMSDELEYLKVEIDSIAAAVKQRFPNVDQRYSLIVYRDEGDDYVVRKYDFTGSLKEFRQTLSEQHAAGGGDYPEAMHKALQEAEKLSWRDRDTARVMFLLADAPPHDADAPATLAAVDRLRGKNVTIFPVAASGTKDRAEFILRATAFLTTGEYLFLTDDSGIGNAHAEPHIPGYNVDRLDRLMIKAIAKELAGRPVPLEQLSQTPVPPTIDEMPIVEYSAYGASDWLATLQTWPVRITGLALLVIGVFWIDARSSSER